MSYFPINIDLCKFRILVIGGGEVATRKVRNLIEFSAKPTIISPIVTSELGEIIDSEDLEFIQRKYQKGDSNGFNMIFVATDDATLDNEIFEDVKNTNVLVNFADKPEKCNFIMPSFLQRGSLVISISTQGRVPFLSKHIRECLEKRFPEEYASLVELSALFRSLILQKKIADKTGIIEEFLNINWIKILCDEGFDFASKLVNNLIEKYEK
ncbi:MAG: precorrin-2 dehydrogenase/sirohydrochlorin ferrochelatase family protein [Candidatus Kapaibacteriales bacterium]